MKLNLEHKNALVCGSTQGIGKAAAFALASEGVKLTLVARNEAKLKDVIASLPNADQHDYIIADFMNPIGFKIKSGKLIFKPIMVSIFLSIILEAQEVVQL